MNGYLVQKLIAPNGTSLITASGSVVPAGLFEMAAQPALSAAESLLESVGLPLPLP